MKPTKEYLIRFLEELILDCKREAAILSRSEHRDGSFDLRNANHEQLARTLKKTMDTHFKLITADLYDYDLETGHL